MRWILSLGLLLPALAAIIGESMNTINILLKKRLLQKYFHYSFHFYWKRPPNKTDNKTRERKSGQEDKNKVFFPPTVLFSWKSPFLTLNVSECLSWRPVRKSTRRVGSVSVSQYKETHSVSQAKIKLIWFHFFFTKHDEEDSRIGTKGLLPKLESCHFISYKKTRVKAELNGITYKERRSLWNQGEASPFHLWNHQHHRNHHQRIKKEKKACKIMISMRGEEDTLLTQTMFRKCIRNSLILFRKTWFDSHFTFLCSSMWWGIQPVHSKLVWVLIPCNHLRIEREGMSGYNRDKSISWTTASSFSYLHVSVVPIDQLEITVDRCSFLSSSLITRL
jgi:hypothetical protein